MEPPRQPVTVFSPFQVRKKPLIIVIKTVARTAQRPIFGLFGCSGFIFKMYV